LGLEEGKIFSESLEENEINVLDGDSFLFFTDGLTDSKNEKNSDFAMNNLLDVIKEYENKSLYIQPGKLLDKLTSEIKSFRNNIPQYDDMTAIVINKKHSSEDT